MNISALHVQYGIKAFATLERPECIRLHLRELQSQQFSWRSMPRNSLEKRAVRSPDGRYGTHIATVYYIRIPRPRLPKSN